MDYNLIGLTSFNNSFYGTIQINLNEEISTSTGENYLRTHTVDHNFEVIHILQS